MTPLKFTEKWATALTPEQYDMMQTPIMVKLVGTVDPKGWPHMTFIATNRAYSPTGIVWGEFMHGKSKQYIQDHPKHAYLFMSITLPFTMLQIKADFTHVANTGQEIEKFNDSKDQRYSTTMNIARVYYSNIVRVSPLQQIPLGKIVIGGIRNMLTKSAARTGLQEERLDKFGKLIFGSITNPKFIAFIDPTDGYPIIIPCFQALPADYTKLVFPATLFKDQLYSIPVGSKIALFGVTMDFIGQEVRGTFGGFQKYRGLELGLLNIEEVYNSGPPLPGRIYPDLEVLPEVTDFTMY